MNMMRRIMERRVRLFMPSVAHKISAGFFLCLACVSPG